MTKAERIQLWLDRLRRQAASQQTVAEFCRLDGISVPSFYQWKRRLSPRVDTDPHVESSPKRRHGKRAASSRFTEVIVSSATTSTHAFASVHASASAEATLPGGITITLGTQPEVAGMIVDRLLQHVLPALSKQVR